MWAAAVDIKKLFISIRAVGHVYDVRVRIQIISTHSIECTHHSICSGINSVDVKFNCGINKLTCCALASHVLFSVSLHFFMVWSKIRRSVKALESPDRLCCVVLLTQSALHDLFEVFCLVYLRLSACVCVCMCEWVCAVRTTIPNFPFHKSLIFSTR